MNEPIAIIGIGCQFPGGVDGPTRFWRLLSEGVDAITEVPPERWSIDAYYDPVPGRIGKSISRWGGFLDGIDRFDAGFFGISPREAASMDPQHRLLLQAAWDALEDGGLTVAGGKQVGVFVGISTNDYAQIQFTHGDLRAINPWTATGGVASIAANHISYCLNLRGPSFAVDTACSSSLLAVHLACTSLRQGECPVALVGGVNALLLPAPFVSFSRSGMLSPDGRCKAFDARANGFVRAEGVGVVALKPLSAAIADGNPIYAVIRGTATNQDGRTSGLSLPSAAAQEALVREACAQAGILPSQIDYVEAHGTGTAVGDPLEFAALAATVGVARNPQAPCMIGSVKTNIGHLEAGAGIAGIIKTALALFHGQIPPSLHFQTPNPHLDFASSNLRVATELQPFGSGETPALAGVNSFGFGGANAHAILEAPPLRLAPKAHRPDHAHLLTLSAKSDAALRDLAAKYPAFLAATTEPLSDICLTAGAHRTHHPYRLALAASTSGELCENLTAFLASETREGLSVSHVIDAAPAPVFVFSGQGPQWWAMGRELLVEEPVFRQKIEECDALVREWGKWSLLEELQRDEATSRMQDTAIAQPAIFAIQMALVAVWKRWGIQPAAVVGHSVGEAAAACTAGVLSLRDAMHVIYQRGRCMGRAPEDGRMLAVSMTPREAESLLEDAPGVSIASFNSPHAVVLSGPGKALETVAASLEGRGIFCRFLTVKYAFHSAQMDPIREELLRSLGDFKTDPASVATFSTVSGEAMSGDDFGPAYWWRNVRQPVRFAAAMESLLAQGHRVFLEIGPHPVLASAMLECLSQRDSSGTVLPSLHRKKPECATLLGSLGALHVRGVPVNWAALSPSARAVRLPSYPWQTQRYWNEAEQWTASRLVPPSHPLLVRTIGTALPTWQTALDLEALTYLKDHRVKGQIVFPAAGYLEMCFGAASVIFKGKPVTLEGVDFQSALFLPDSEQATSLQLSYDPREGSLTISSTRGGTAWTTHVVGGIGAGIETDAVTSIEAVRARCTEVVSSETSQRQFADTGLDFGPAFHGMETVYRRDGEALGRVVLPTWLDAGKYQIHPALLDACFQVLSHTLPAEMGRERRLFLPVQVERARFFARPGKVVWSHARLIRHGGKTLVGDIEILNEAGRLLITVEGFRCQAVPSAHGENGQTDDWCHEFQWHPDPSEYATLARPDPRHPTTWLILADRGGFGRSLAERLTARGDTAVLAFSAESYARQTAAEYQVRPGSRDDFQHLLAEIRAADFPTVGGVMHLWNLDAGDPATLNADALHRAQEEGCYSVVPMVQTLAEETTPPRLWLITRGAQAVQSGDSAAPAQAPIWGLGRVLLNELPKLRCRLVDLSPDEAEADAEQFLKELEIDDREEEIAHRGGLRYVHRLVKISAAQLPLPTAPEQPDAPYRLELGAIASIDQLAFRARSRRPPAAGEVEIEVRAAGLNFRDVMKALGIYPSEDDADCLLGDECAGRIVSIGRDVEGLQIGDAVVAMAPGSFGSHVTLPAHLFVPKPTGLSFEEAATLPVAFLTAWHALHHLGRLRKGESVLIQAAAGGVGLAAVQVAQHLGAEIFATAGSPEKRSFLHSLGIRHVMDSRSLAFADEVRTLTDGRGVDMVLNSLAGEAIAKGMACLAPHGRFLELGKRDIFQNTKLGLRPFRNNLAFFGIDLAQVLRDSPAVVHTMLREIMELVAAGHFRPLPLRCFPLSQASEAFRTMSQARHIGKIVLSRESDRVLAIPEEIPMQFEASASYLITGGLSGFGLAVAEWMLQNGARHLVLVGRSGSSSEAARQAVAKLTDLGGEIVVLAADVASAPDVTRIFATVAAQLPPLRGIVHSAMVMEDRTLLQQSSERFQRVLAPKVAGAWNLHAASANVALDFFVLFSSVSAIIGNPGQSSYAAANCFLDALAHHRRARGLPALAIDWGMLKEVGHVARTAGLEAHLQHHGLAGFTVAESTMILGRLLQTDVSQVGAFRFHGRSGAQTLLGHAKSPRFAALSTGDDSARSGEVGSAREAILALPSTEQLAACTSHLAEEVARVLRTSASRLDLHTPFNELGFDSLMSVELGNRLEAAYGIALSPGVIESETSLSKLATKLLEIVTGAPVGPATAPAFPPASPLPESEAAPTPIPSPSIPPAVETAPPSVPEDFETEQSTPPPLSKALQMRFHVESLALRGVLACFRGLDSQQVQKRLRLLSPVMTRVLRQDWRWAVQNLKLIFGPNLTEKERKRLATLAFEHHLSSYLEGMRHADLEVDFHHEERLLECHAEGRGVILCGVHLGSWEAVLHHGAKAGLPIVGVYRRAQNPRSDQVFQEIRAAYGIEWIVSKDVEAISRALRAGKIVGLMTDLNTLSGGTVADFLGVPATCPSGPARLALLQNVPLVPAVAVRMGEGRICAHFEHAIRPPQNAYSDVETQRLTRQINAHFEPWILEYAEQYNWLHPRWRARPDGSRWNLQMSDTELERERTAPFLRVSDRVRRLLA